MRMRKNNLATFLVIIVLFSFRNIGMTSADPEATVDAVYGTHPTIDGTISAGEWTDASTLTLSLPDGDATVYIQHDGSSLYIAFDIPDTTPTTQSSETHDEVSICLDTEHNGGSSPQSDDRYYFVFRGSEGVGAFTGLFRSVGTGTDWGNGYRSELVSCSVKSDPDRWRVEIKFPADEIGAPANGDKIGLGIYITDGRDSTSSGASWPLDVNLENPNSWGDIFSSDYWSAPPTLTSVNFSPTSGEFGTNFTFEITYVDIDNDFPAEGYPVLYIDGEAMGGEMADKNPSDSDVRDGKVYKYTWVTTSADIGAHTFSTHVINQLGETARSPPTGFHTGPTVTKIPQVLTCNVSDNSVTAGQVVAFSGYLRDSKGAGLGGKTVELYKDGSKTLTTVTEHDGYYSLSYTIPSTPRTSQYYVRVAGDENYEPSQSATLSVTINQPPTLTAGSVNLLSGTEGTTFIFEVTYADPDNDLPFNITVYIDNKGYPMSLVSGDHKTGALYSYNWLTTSADIGSHTYYFGTSDGYEMCVLPSSGTYSGPNITGEEFPILPVVILSFLGCAIAVGILYKVLKK